MGNLVGNTKYYYCDDGNGMLADGGAVYLEKEYLMKLNADVFVNLLIVLNLGDMSCLIIMRWAK